MLILREYQEEAITRVMASWQKHREALEKHEADMQYGLNPEPFVAGCELLVLATGAGKTIIFSEIIRLLAEQGVLSLILAHRDDLLDQAIEKYHAIKPSAIVGKIAASKNDLGGELTVASVQTAKNAKRLKQLQQFNYGLIVVDEGHHMAANGYQTVLKAFPHAFVLVVTATPDRLDDKPILAGKEALYSRGIVDLVKEGYLATPRAIAIRTDVSLDEIKTLAGDFHEKELGLAVDTPARNKRIVDAYVEHANGMPAIAFCVTVAHARSLAYTFNDHGINAAVVCGTTPTEERKALYAELRSGELKILVSIQVLTEGFDEPCVSCVIMARPTKSRALYVQCIGRGARLFPGKEYFLVLDITDNCLKHRLTPHNLNKALHLKLKDAETIEEAEEREQLEKEKEAQIRKLKEKRKEDLIIDLLQKFDWKKRESDGAYILEFGAAAKFGKPHKIALRPEYEDAWNPFDIPQYSVWASLAPNYTIQKWAGAMPFVEALQYAETRVLKIQDEPHAVKLFDKNAEWRKKLVDMNSPQVQQAKWMRIEIGQGMTKGQLSDLIDEKKRQKEEKKTNARKQKVRG